MMGLHGSPAVLAALLLLLRLQPAFAPIPCQPETMYEVEVGEQRGMIGFSQAAEHDTTEERDCLTINFGYEGTITIFCFEGNVNATVEGCGPRRCLAYDALSVSLGDLTKGVSPLQTILSFESEDQVCRDINPLYRGKFTLFCNYGQLSIDISQCVTQWDPMERPPWRARSRHTAVGLSDGALLLMGGLGESGPMAEVWQWTPSPGTLTGTWEMSQKPPWSGRFGAAAVWQVAENGEQVMLLGGNDGQNKRDVWRWLRQPSIVAIPLEESDHTGTQRDDCSLEAGTLTCSAAGGVTGRRWTVPYQLWTATRVSFELRYSSNDVQYAEGMPHGGRAVVALMLDGCRQTFEMNAAGWSSTGCTERDPPWAITEPSQVVSDGTEVVQGQWQAVHLELDREALQVRLLHDGQAEPYVIDIGGCSATAGADEGASRPDDCSARPPVTEMMLYSIEVVAWPYSSVEVRSLYVISAPGVWQLIVDEAPWPARSAHATVALPDGDVLLMGGLGNDGLLNDVWRWTPQRCTLLPDLLSTVAARYELECSFDCVASVPFGQWARLPTAPWAPRQELAGIWSSAGLLVMGGRTAEGFENDVWRWKYSGAFCSLEWRGHWDRLVAAAPWPQRHGHSIVGFPPRGAAGADRVLLLGGFGGQPEHSQVERTPVEFPVTSRNDLWCAHASSNFSEWVQLAPISPFSPRAQASLVVAPTIGDYSMLLFGGYDRSARLVSDLWQWTGENASGDCTLVLQYD